MAYIGELHRAPLKGIQDHIRVILGSIGSILGFGISYGRGPWLDLRAVKYGPEF